MYRNHSFERHRSGRESGRANPCCMGLSPRLPQTRSRHRTHPCHDPASVRSPGFSRSRCRATKRWHQDAHRRRRPLQDNPGRVRVTAPADEVRRCHCASDATSNCRAPRRGTSPVRPVVGRCPSSLPEGGHRADDTNPRRPTGHRGCDRVEQHPAIARAYRASSGRQFTGSRGGVAATPPHVPVGCRASGLRQTTASAIQRSCRLQKLVA